MDENNENQEVKSEEPSSEKRGLNPMLIIGILIAAVILIGGFLLTRSQRNTMQEESTVGTDETQGGPIDNMNEMQDSTTPEVSSPEGEMQQDDSIMMDEGETKTIDVEGGAYYFKPNEIRVNKGDTVHIVFTNAGGMHDFVIDEFNVKTKITQTGEMAEVEFTADKAGEYEFYCNVANHRALGMRGALIVE